MEPRWKHQIAKQVRRLAHRYDAIAPLFQAYTSLLGCNRELKKKAEESEKELDAVKEEYIALRHTKTGVPRAQARTAVEYEKLEAKYKQKCESLLQIYEERDQVRSSELEARARADRLEKELEELEKKHARTEEAKGSQQELIESLNNLLEQREMSIASLQDEIRALSLQFTVVEEQRQAIEKERNELLERLLCMKQDEADLHNQYLATDTKKRHEQIKQEIADASKELPDVDEQPPLLRLGLPTKATHHLDAHPGGAYAIRHSPSGSRFVSGGADHTIKVWTSSGHNTTVLREHTGTVTCLDFSPASDNLVSASNDKSVLIWSLRTNRSLFRCTGHTDKVYAARYLGHTKLISASQDRTMKLWDGSRGNAEKTFMVHSTCYDIVSVDGPRFLSCHYDKCVREWDIRQSSQKPSREVQTGHRDPITAIALSPSRDYLLTSCKDGQLKLVDLLQMRVVKTFVSDEVAGGPSGCHPSFSPDGAHFAVGRPSGVVEIWNVNKAEVVKTLSTACHSGFIHAVSWGPSQLVSVGKDGKAIAWEEDDF